LNSKYERSVLTIAGGNKLYIDMACNLAMSFLYWNKDSGIQFYLVTDRADLVPAKLRADINIIAKTPDELNKGFSSKLQIGEFIQTKQTLFIDADCLVYGNLNEVFELFEGHSTSVIGFNLTEGIDTGFCRDIKSVLAKTGTSYFPMFCGSIYYIEEGETAHNIFRYANSLLSSYDDLGLIRLRNRENEEPLISLSMAKFKQQPVNDTGFIKADRMYYDNLSSNILQGRARLWSDKQAPVPIYSTLLESQPKIVHFNASYSEIFEYKSEVSRIRKVYLYHWPKTFANVYAFLGHIMPGKLSKFTKDRLRPLYRLLFGYRKIQPSQRIVND